MNHFISNILNFFCEREGGAGRDSNTPYTGVGSTDLGDTHPQF